MITCPSSVGLFSEYAMLYSMCGVAEMLPFFW